MAQTLQVRLKDERFKIGVSLTKRYGNKFDRAFEAEVFYQQGRVKLPSEHTQWGHDVKMTGVKDLRTEFKEFTESDVHATDDILDCLNWEVVAKFGNAPSSAQYAYGNLQA